MKRKSWSALIQALFFLILPISATSALAEPVSLKRVVELALSHGTSAAIAQADQQRAFASYHELRNNYIPQLIAGAGLGWSDGFPLSLEGAAPSLFNVNAQSALINPALKDFIRAARSDYAVSALHTKDQRNQIIQDAVMSYAELAKWESRLAHLRETKAATEKMETAVARRVQEGVESEMDATRARLSVSRIHLRMVEALGSADVIREHLSGLTGLVAASIETDPSSLPAPPAIKTEDLKQEEEFRGKALEANPELQAAVEHARAQYLRLKGEKKSLWPSVDFAAQYANLAAYNNYERFYQKGSFQPNNATVGVAIHFPFLNLAEHARVQEAESEAFKARKQAEAARNQVSEETLRLQRTVAQMQAARDVAALEYEIAEKSLTAIPTRMDAGTATLHDLDDARTQASEKFMALQDITLELERSQLGLLRVTGELEKWALGGN
ncbi:MAG TPA: TolC family protein [Candidatus Sulfotelmatobacter sp.]